MRIVRKYIKIIVDACRSSVLARRGLVTALVLLMAAPLIVRGANRGIESMFNAPLRWVPRNSESRAQFNEFLDLFEVHELAVVSWPGCEVDDERLKRALNALQQIRRERAAEGQPELFSNVLSGHNLLEDLMSPPIDLSREAALRRLQGVLVGEDGKPSCVVIEITDYGADKHRRTTMQLIIEAVTESTGLDRDSLIVAGPPSECIAIDDESIRSIQTYSPMSVVISLVLCWICLRSLWLSAPILIIAAFGQGLMLAMVHYGGYTMNAILIVLPALVFVLTVSAGVHLTNYFLEELSSNPIADAPQRAILSARVPCALAAITTAIGLASLCVSEVEPVRQFGGLGAIGLLVSVGLLFLLVPAFHVLWLLRPSGVPGTTKSQDQQPRFSAAFAVLVSRYGLPIRFVCVAAMIFCAFGFAHLRTSIDVVTLLAPENAAVRNFRWFEQNIGPLIPVEVIVHFDRDCELDSVERLKLVRAIQIQVRQIDQLDGDMSAATFVPSFPRGGGVGGVVRNRVFRRRIESSRDDLIAAKYLAETDKGEAYRISARVLGQSEFDYGSFLDQLREVVDPILAKVQASGYSGVSATYTGVTAVAYQIQESLLADLFKSFITALCLVAVVMMIALRSITCGLLAMLPNVFPTVLLFGSMGIADRPVDIGSVMTASVALGIAVDGTFHFLKWFLHSLNQGDSREAAILVAYQHCGRALVQTTFICACGLLVFTLSGFLPARNFSWMLLLLLVVALFGDLVLLPALLSGGLGRILHRINRPNPGVAVSRQPTAVSLSPSEDSA